MTYHQIAQKDLLISTLNDVSFDKKSFLILDICRNFIKIHL